MFKLWKEKVLVAAPGEGIYSTVPGKGYGYMTGTSQSTAFVSGLAALVKSVNKNLKPYEIKNIIAASVDANLEFKDKFATSGKINALSAVKMASNLKGLTPLNAKKLIGS
jgi:subtilisin family serine protease